MGNICQGEASSSLFEIPEKPIRQYMTDEAYDEAHKHCPDREVALQIRELPAYFMEVLKKQGRLF